MQFGASRDQIPLKYAPLTSGYNGYRYTEQAQLGLGLNLVVGTVRFLATAATPKNSSTNATRPAPALPCSRAT